MMFDTMLDFLAKVYHINMKILLVLCHPRADSFTAAIADTFAKHAIASGHEVERADLYREGFDPVMRENDEPSWDNLDKIYSDEVLAEMARIERNEAIVMVCPIWWWSFPAMLKGWVDRVWNLGFAYGPSKLSLQKGMLIGTCASNAERFARHGTDTAIQTQLGSGIMGYCGIDEYCVELFHDAVLDNNTREGLLLRAGVLGDRF
jgi:NAD(P)H dehydrogenase (quinone)